MTNGSDARYARAWALADAGRWTEAAAELAPEVAGGSPALLALAAEVVLALGAYGEACELARRAAVGAQSIWRAPAFVRYLRLLRRLEMLPEIGRLLEPALPSGLSNGEVAEVALIASSAGLHERAAGFVAALREHAPGFADAHYLAGMLDMFAGRREASLQALACALAIEPRMANAHWLVAMQGDASTADAHVQALQRALAGIVPESEADVYVRFALHRRLHVLGRYEEAWQALEAGMRIARRADPYVPAREAALFDAVRRLQLPHFAPAAQGAGVGLIFIVGMFRSGTSLIERVLTRHPDVVDGGETFQFTAALREAADHECRGVIDAHMLELAPRLDFDHVRARMLAYARWRAGARAWVTEKLPSNFMNVGLIAHAFPEARIIHLRRDPVATCFSNLRTYFRGVANYSNSVADFADYHGRYEQLMEHWHRTLPGRVLDVVYEDFVARPEQRSREILDFCGLPFRSEVLDVSAGGGHSATASAADVRSGIQAGRGREWLPYREHLAPILRARNAPRP